MLSDDFYCLRDFLDDARRVGDVHAVELRVDVALMRRDILRREVVERDAGDVHAALVAAAAVGVLLEHEADFLTYDVFHKISDFHLCAFFLFVKLF